MMTNTYLPHIGGVARSVSTFAEEYRRLKHRVLVIAPDFDGPPLTKRAASIVERVSAIQNFNGSDFSVRIPMAAGLSTRLDDFRADIIHAHHPFLLGDTALRIGARKNVPVIFTHHTRYEDYTHYVPFDSPTLKEMAITLSTEFANMCAGVIAPSESIAKLISARGVKAPITVIPTGIAVEAFSGGNGMRFRKKFKIPQHAYVVGYVGRLAMEKNLKYLATAVSLFLKEKPEALFLVVGTGPSEKEMKEIFKEHGVGGQIIFAGSQSGRALYDAYNAMNLFAFASFSETQGMVLAEAMAAGLPVVALDANGVREVVQQNTNGFLLPEKTPDRIFAHHLEILRSNASLQQRFADSARTTAYKFSKEHCAELALKFYGKINKSTRRARMQTDITPWGTLLERVNMEWKLLAQKTQSVMNAITSDKDNTD